MSLETRLAALVAAVGTDIKTLTARSSKWYSGTGVPAGALAGTIVGDWYLNDTNGDIYEKTGASAWTLRDNLTGPTGAAGGGVSQPLEAVHIVGAAGEPAFSGGWVNFDAPGAGARLARFRKDPFGRVRLGGLIKNGVVGSTAFTLPVGFRPPLNYQRFAVDSGTAHGTLLIANSGTVLPEVGTNVFFDLSSVEFDTEAVTSYSPAVIGPALVSVLPVTPFDGQECYFQTAAMKTDNVGPWHLRYDASLTGSKWAVINGTPIVKPIAANATSTSAGFANPTTGTIGPDWTSEIAGEYRVELRMGVLQANASGYAIAGVSYGGVTATTDDIFTRHATVNAGQMAASMPIAKTIPAAQLLRVQYRVTGDGGTATFWNRALIITPLRLGP